MANNYKWQEPYYDKFLHVVGPEERKGNYISKVQVTREFLCNLTHELFNRAYRIRENKEGMYFAMGFGGPIELHVCEDENPTGVKLFPD